MLMGKLNEILGTAMPGINKNMLLDIVQSFPLLSYCIVGPMSVYIYKSNM